MIEKEKSRLSSYKQIINFIGKPFVFDVLLIGTTIGILSALDKSDSGSILEATKEILTGSNSAIAITTASSVSLYLITLAVYWLYLKKNTPVISSSTSPDNDSPIKEEKKIKTSPIVELPEPVIAKEKNLDYIGLAQPGQKLFFPHVDTCLAIMIELRNGNVIGGHVPLQWDSNQNFSFDNPEINFLRVTQEMQKKFPYQDSDIVQIYLVGDENWRSLSSNYKAFGNKFHFICTEAQEGVNCHMQRGHLPTVIPCSREFQILNSTL